MENLGWTIATLLTSAISVLSGFLFVFRWCRLDRSVRNELVHLQLLALITADVFVAMAVFSYYFIPVVPDLLPKSTMDTLCNLTIMTIRRSRFLSTLMESHIAVSLVVLAFRGESWMRGLRTGLFVVWLIATVVALLQNYDLAAHLSEHPDMCVYQGKDHITPFVVIGCFAISLSSYIAVACWANCCTVMESHLWNLAGLYPLSFAITYLPHVCQYVHWAAPPYLVDQIGTLADLCQGAGGFVHIVVYVYVMQKSSKVLGRSSPGRNSILNSGVSDAPNSFQSTWSNVSAIQNYVSPLVSAAPASSASLPAFLRPMVFRRAVR